MPDTVAWNFRHMHEEPSRFSCTLKDLCEYAQRLKDYEASTRSEIESHRNSNHGWKTMKRLDKELRILIKRTPCFTDTRLSQLELSGKCRAFGFYKDNVFHFVFLDKNHEGYSVAH